MGYAAVGLNRTTTIHARQNVTAYRPWNLQRTEDRFLFPCSPRLSDFEPETKASSMSETFLWHCFRLSCFDLTPKSFAFPFEIMLQLAYHTLARRYVNCSRFRLRRIYATDKQAQAACNTRCYRTDGRTLKSQRNLTKLYRTELKWFNNRDIRLPLNPITSLSVRPFFRNVSTLTKNQHSTNCH